MSVFPNSSNRKVAPNGQRVNASEIIAENFSFRIDTQASVQYIGLAAIGSLNSQAVWQILRITTSGTVQTGEYADGNDNFDNIWDNRAALSYS